MPYYPEQSLIVSLSLLRRERKLPPNAIGEVMVQEGQSVEPNTVVLRGAVPSGFVILDAVQGLGLKHAGQISEDMLQVQPGEVVLEGQPILQIGTGRRAPTLKSPTTAVFARLDSGRVILQADPMPVEVLALTPGRVTSVRGDKLVLIESTGTLIQGAWGNGLSVYAPLVLEPDEGLASLDADLPAPDYNGAAMVLRDPILSPDVFNMALQQSVVGLVASSMHSSLREEALAQGIPILLTEGFGELQMSEIVYNLLRANANRPAAIDAAQPSRWTAERPEIIIPLGANTRARPPEKDQPLQVGAQVRILRQPNLGQTGRVFRLVETPRLVEIGLRLPGAEVQLGDGQVIFVPLANLELLGRPAEQQGRA